MIDTGAAPNLIKRRSVRSEVIVRDENVYLSGITKERIKTLGTIKISYMGYPIELQVVPDNFPITQEGILGSDFLEDVSVIDLENKAVRWQGVQIPFSQRDTVVIPARSRTTFFVKVKNPSVQVGYIPRLRACKGIYLGNAAVENRDGRAYLQAINTNDIDHELVVPTLELQEIEQISMNDQQCQTTITQEILTITGTKDEGLKNPGNGACTDDIRKLLRLEHLNREETNDVASLINEHNDLFRLPGDNLGHTSVIAHRITTTDEQPIHTKQYRFPPIHKEEIDKQIKELLDNDVIRPSESPYNSPLWIVPKKADSKGNKRWRMVIDYRALNEKTIGDAYPLPNITEILDQLGSAKYFSVFDLASGFHQIPMDDAHAQKTTFSTPHGHYEFNRMPFGLKNALATFQRLMDQVLTGLQGTELFVYLDDIVLYASSLREHKIKFDKLAERLRSANLKLQPDKCEFLRKEVGYLEHIIGRDGVKPDPSKISAVKEFLRPRNAKNIKQFLGLAGYYRRFIPNFSKAARPLTDLLKKDEEFRWKEEQEQAFAQLRNALCTEPILQYPDFAKPFVVTTDASGYAIGGILSQGPIGKDAPMAYTSRLLNNAEKNYSTIEKELLAIVYCVNHFRPYLYGRKFSLVTDHKPLVWLHSVKDPTSRLVRWRLKLAEYEYDVIYKAGKTNVNADALSRNPVEAKTTREDAQVLPVDQDTTPSDSDQSLFNAKPGGIKMAPSCAPAPEDVDDTTRHKPISESESDAESYAESRDDTNEHTGTDDSSDSDSTEGIFDNPNTPSEPKRPRGFRVTHIPDNFLTRRDNLLVFIT